MLLNNGDRLWGGNVSRMVAGPTGNTGSLGGHNEPGLWRRGGQAINFATVSEATSGGIALKASYPEGKRHPSTVRWPVRAGGLAARGGALAGLGEITEANLAGGKNASATLTGLGQLTAFGALIVSGSATLAGVGGIVGADLRAILQASATLSGSGAITNADLRALGNMLATLTGVGTLTAPNYATGALSATIVICDGAELTADDIASAVWNAIAASYDLPGTMGEKMNDAGSAANPWTEIIEAGYTAEELMRLMAAVLLGKASGGGTATRTFRDVNDTIDRVDATVEADGDRTAVTLDPS